MEPFILKDKQYFLIGELTDGSEGFLAGFTTRNGGKSTEPFGTLNFGFHVEDKEENVRQNRKILSDLIEFPLDQWVGAEQTHGITIQKVTKDARGKGSINYEEAFKATDGFYTREKGILLTLCFADCVPLFFFSSKHKAMGVAHAGWKGSVNGIGEEMISVFNKDGINPKDIFVVIGPSICEKCYIVDDRVIKLVQNRLEHVEEKPYNLIKENQYHLNLQKLNELILINNGVPIQNIRVTNYCTKCHQDLFFSHRGDNGKTGRMISFMGWKEDLLV